MEHRDYFDTLQNYLADQQPLWQVTIVSTSGSSPSRAGMKMCIPLNAKEFGNLGGGEMEHTLISYVRDKQPEHPEMKTFILSDSGASVEEAQGISTSMICGGSSTVFIEQLNRLKPLFVIGAGHCGRALGEIAMQGGFHVTLIDNRADILGADAARFCHAFLHCDYSDIAQQIRFSKQARVVIMTHGHVHDKAVLQQCLRRDFLYLGMIGSKSKVAQTMDRLRTEGYTDAELCRVHAPIGMPIGSQTPFEIAISILAELISIDSAQRKG